MNASGRLFVILLWLVALVVAGSLVLGLTAARVGEHKSSTYGYAYVLFQQGWGGEIGIIPPNFSVRRDYTESVFNKDADTYEDVARTQTFPLVPRSIDIKSDVVYAEKIRSLLVFNAFEIHNTETYIVVNTSGYAGDLQVKVTTPENANILYDYTVTITSRDNLIIRPALNAEVLLLPEMKMGEQVEVVITYSTKGMDIFKYNLSAYQNSVIQRLKAEFKLNTQEYAIYREGLPHTEDFTADGAVLRFEVNDFSTTQDMGIAFLQKQMYLDRVQSLMTYSPVSLILLLAVVFLFSQIFAVRFNAFHYFFLGVLDVFYYLFVAYLIRFFSIIPTFVIAIVLTAAMFMLYSPNVFGKWFAYRVVGLYLFLLTVVFSLIFLIPIFQGLLFVVLVFLIFTSIMVFVARSDISSWHILKD